MSPGSQSHAFGLALLLSVLGHGLLLLTETAGGRGSWSGVLPPHSAAAPTLPIVATLAPATRPDTPQAQMPTDHATAWSHQDPTRPAGSAPAHTSTPIYYHPDQLDSPPLPVSAPDVSRLQRLVFSGQAIRLRLWINPQGQVERVDVLKNDPADQQAVTVVQAMYYDTAYMSPRRQGLPVAVRMDIEMDFTPEVMVPHKMTLFGKAGTLPEEER